MNDFGIVDICRKCSRILIDDSDGLLCIEEKYELGAI